MGFEYKVVDSVDDANRLADEGFELFTILPPGPAGGADRIYLRREKPRGQAPGFLRESKA
ncbi:MAG TPA: hypothetical protein VIO62_06680 [Candidatus Dormibacteraeota bacterium]